MRILEVILAPIVGGAQSLVNGLTREWRLTGNDVDILALDPAPSPSAAKAARDMFGYDIPSALGRWARGRCFPVKHCMRTLSLRRHIRRKGYDVVHSHTFLPNMYSRLALLTLPPRPAAVITLHSAGHDYAPRKSRAAERLLSPLTDAAIAVSDSLLEEYRQLFPQNRRKVTLIPNGIPWPIAAKLKYAKRPRVFLSTSRISPQKDIETMVLGFNHFAEESKADVQLLLAGPFDDQGYADRILRLRETLTHKDKIHFLGARTDIGRLLRLADVLVHSALREAHPISILEAAAAGLPIVTTDIREIRSCIGDYAEFFGVGDHAALASALRRAATDWDAATTRAAAIAPTIARQFSMKACAEAYMQVLGKVSTKS